MPEVSSSYARDPEAAARQMMDVGENSSRTIDISMPASLRPPRTQRPRVGFDESGNTGADLLNADQPLFALASVGLDENDTAAVLGDMLASEHHSVSARRSRVGRDRTLRVLDAPALALSTVKIAVVHKSFMATSKFVDLVLEPIAANLGLDLYQQGQHLALSNLFHMTWPVFDPVGTSQLVRTFIAWSRHPSSLSSTALGLATRRMAPHAPDGIDDLMRIAARELIVDSGKFGHSTGINDLDPAGPALVALLHEWAHELGAFRLLHDDSAEIQRWLPHLTRLSDSMSGPVEVQLWNGQALTYPLPIEHVALSASERSAQIQLADLVAGASTIAFGSLTTAPRLKYQSFASELLDTRLPSWVVDASIWPTASFGPEELGAQPDETSWAIDRLAAWNQ